MIKIPNVIRLVYIYRIGVIKEENILNELSGVEYLTLNRIYINLNTSKKRSVDKTPNHPQQIQMEYAVAIGKGQETH